MVLKDPKTIITGLYKKHAKIEGNLIKAEKLFMINSLINTLFAGIDYKNVDKKQLAEYASLVDMYIKNEVDLRWEDGKLQVEEINSGDSNGN